MHVRIPYTDTTSQTALYMSIYCLETSLWISVYMYVTLWVGGDKV
jgi:hypothetical protein